MAETPLVFEIATFAVLAVFFVVDLFIIGRKPHVPSTKECVQHIAFFVVMALIFGGLMWFFAGSKPAIEFYSGWLTEYSLSIDNLFVFVIIMSNFAVPKELQKFVLSVGITVALVLRGMFILVGAAIISRFTWVFFLFGAFLIVTAIKLVAGGDEDEEYHENALIHALRKVIKITDEYDGDADDAEDMDEALRRSAFMDEADAVVDVVQVADEGRKTEEEHADRNQERSESAEYGRSGTLYVSGTGCFFNDGNAREESHEGRSTAD